MKYIVLLLVTLLSAPAWALAPEPLTIHSTAAEHRFTVEVARTQTEQEHGLMDRTELAADQGMLFLFPETKVEWMWMKDTHISLDMLFIDAGGRIVYIAERTVPETTNAIGPNKPVAAVLDLPGNTAAHLGIEVGDRIIHPAFEGKK